MKQLLFLTICLIFCSQVVAQVKITPNFALGMIMNGREPTAAEILGATQIFLRDDDGNIMKGYRIIEGSVIVEGRRKVGKVLENGFLDDNAKLILKQSVGKQVTILGKYSEPDGFEKMTALVFDVK